MMGAAVLLAALALGQPPQETGGRVSTPATVVAGHVRSALSNPDEVMNWAILEASVQDLESATGTAPNSSWSSPLETAGYWVGEIAEVAGTEVAFGLALIATILLTGRLVSRQMRGPARARLSAAHEPGQSEPSSGRAWTATVLSDRGLSELEIARRTGLARDAVLLALSTQTVQMDPKQRSVA
jgi:hypothetical protein